MKKLLAMFLLLTFLVGMLSGCMMLPLGLDYPLAPLDTENTENTLHWLPAESYFVDYEITDNTVKFRYAICFVNNSGSDCSVTLSAKFHTKDLKGWTENNDFLDGCDENGEWVSHVIPNGEKVVHTYCFTVPYSGGTVNTDIQFPEEILLSTSFVE